MELLKLNLQMFADGIINETSVPTGHFRIVWSSTPIDGTNTSTVTATAQIQKTSSNQNTSGTFSGTITIDGTDYSVSKYRTDWNQTWKDVATVKKVVEHNSDGSKSITISSTLKQAGTSMAGTYKASGTATLDKINRGSVLGLIDDFILSTSVVITLPITIYTPSYKTNFYMKVNGYNYKTIENVTDGTQVTFSSSEVNYIKQYMTNGQITIPFIVETLDGSTLISQSIQEVLVIDASQIMGLSRYKSSKGYLYAINGALNKSLEPGLQVNGKLYMDGVEIKDQNQLMGVYTGSTTISSTAHVKLTLTEKVKNGSLLSISDGGIKIGAGVTKVEVSGNVYFSTGMNSGDSIRSLIYKNDEVVARNFNRCGGTYEDRPISPILLSVSEGDIIYLYGANATAGRGTIIENNYLVVKVIA